MSRLGSATRRLRRRARGGRTSRRRALRNIDPVERLRKRQQLVRRVSRLWQHVHLGDDPHILVAEQIYKGQRKRLKTDASMAKVPLSPTMAAWLSELRPPDAAPDAPVFPSTTGTPLHYHNVYNRVLRPALRASGIAVETGDGWDYQGVAFHAFRKACGSLLLAQGKNLKQVQGWLRHSQLTTTLNVYIHETDDGLGGADAWDDVLGDTWGHRGAPQGPENTETAEPVTLVETLDLQARS